MSKVIDPGLRPGERCGDRKQAVVVAASVMHPGGNGLLPHGVVFCVLPDNPTTPWCTWEYVRREDGSVYVTGGEYCRSLPDAVESFDERVLKVLARADRAWEATHA